MSMEMQRVIFRFKRPSGSDAFEPSEAMHEALMLLSESDEVQPLFEDADKAGKFVAIEVFHNRAGAPVLIYFTQEAA